MYFVRTPYIIKKLFPQIIWNIKTVSASGKSIYLTFDDGPNPEITPWVLMQLKKYDVKATFFCLGKNAEKYPEIVKQILAEGHVIGNHGYAHLNGWKTTDAEYLEDAKKAQEILMQFQPDNKLFRPAYGKMKLSQLKIVNRQSSIVNWSLMPGDFDQNISSETCYSNFTNNIKSGDIVVLHDNKKARNHLEYCLPKWLEEFKQYKFEKIQ